MIEHKPCFGKCDRCFWYWHDACSEWLDSVRKFIFPKSKDTKFKPLPRDGGAE